MTTRKLIHEDEGTRTYEVRDDKGKVIGRDIESKAVELTAEERLAALEDEVRGIKAAAAAEAAKAVTTADDLASAVANAKPKADR